jgi:hypothetical protein
MDSAGFQLFVKQDCQTCTLLVPVFERLRESLPELAIYVQDDPAFLSSAGAAYDKTLENSFRADIEITPTLIRMAGKNETGRVCGWVRDEWRSITGIADLGCDLPAYRPGCGSKTRQPGVWERLLAEFGDAQLKSRRIQFGEWDDPVETCFERGWTDGLPVVPPSDERILRMLSGTSRRPDETVGLVPPNLSECTVEKVAINAVMAGCKPEYMPVVLAALEAALDPLFTMHGLLCTTYFSGPIVIVNGPITRAINMNWGINALGQGNRANATIGRALQLIIRNVGGGRPGEIDRATLGQPGKYTFCFAEDETDPAWEPLSVARGIPPGRSAVTLFQGDGIQGFVDQKSRAPEELTRSLAMGLAAVSHPKQAQAANAILILSPEHYGIFRDAGWDRTRITKELHAALVRPGRDLIVGALGVGEGIAASRAHEMVPKFWDDGLLIVRAGGPAGLFSAICGGWLAGRARAQTKPVTKEIRL